MGYKRSQKHLSSECIPGVSSGLFYDYVFVPGYEFNNVCFLYKIMLMKS